MKEKKLYKRVVKKIKGEERCKDLLAVFLSFFFERKKEREKRNIKKHENRVAFKKERKKESE